MINLIKIFIRCTSILALVVVSACTSNTLRLQDKSAPRASVSINKPLGNLWVLQANIRHIDGDDKFEITDSSSSGLFGDRPFTIQNEIIEAPDTLQNDFTLQSAHVVAFYKVVRNDRFKLNIGPGLGRYRSKVDVLVQGTGRTFSIDNADVCDSLNMELIFSLSPSTSISLVGSDARVGLFCDDDEDADALTYGANFIYKVSNNVSIALGHYRQEYQNTNEFEPELDITTAGVDLGIQINF